MSNQNFKDQMSNQNFKDQVQALIDAGARREQAHKEFYRANKEAKGYYTPEQYSILLRLTSEFPDAKISGIECVDVFIPSKSCLDGQSLPYGVNVRFSPKGEVQCGFLYLRIPCYNESEKSEASLKEGLWNVFINFLKAALKHEELHVKLTAL